MEDSSTNFVQTLREKLAGFVADEDKSTDTSGIEVEEHEFEDLDEATQTRLVNLFDTMRIKRETKSNEDAFKTVRTRTLSSI